MSDSAGAMPRVLYIAGYGRSGSTLVCRLLGQQPGIFAAGELVSFAEWAGSGQACSCGEAVRSCPLWSRVPVESPSGAPGDRRWQAVIDSFLSRLLGYWWIPRRERERYRARNRALFQAIAAASGAAIVVDSSKSTLPSAGRAQALSAIAGLDVRVIHLVRSPQAVRRSLVRGTNRELEGRDQRVRRFPRLRAYAGWSIANALARRTASRAFAGRSALIRYEELLSAPEHATVRLESIAGESLAAVRAALRGDVQGAPQHLAEGNRMRLEPLCLRPIEAVQAAWPDRWLCALMCGLLSIRLGYTASGGIAPLITVPAIEDDRQA